MNKQFRNAFLRLAILLILRKKDVYGYDLIKQISETFNLTAGVLYPILYKLADEGLVVTYLQESSEGGVRKYYHLNQKGQDAAQQELQDWEDLLAKYQSFLKKLE